MLLRLEAADRLVRLVEARGAVDLDDAATALLALTTGPLSAARAVLERVVAADARLESRHGAVRLAPSPLAPVAIEEARFCIVDLETTALVAERGRIAELGAVVLERGEVACELEIVGPAAGSDGALQRLFRLARGAVLAGHNLRFDLAFLEHASARSGTRIAAPIVDTLLLSRRLLRGRVERFGLDSLAAFVGTGGTPCHRALPDARVTGELLGFLLSEARERGARTVADLCALARPLSRCVD